MKKYLFVTSIVLASGNAFGCPDISGTFDGRSSAIKNIFTIKQNLCSEVTFDFGSGITKTYLTDGVNRPSGEDSTGAHSYSADGLEAVTRIGPAPSITKIKSILSLDSNRDLIVRYEICANPDTSTETCSNRSSEILKRL